MLFRSRIVDIEVAAAADPDLESVLLVEVRYRISATNVDRNFVYPFYLRREQDL